MLRITGGTLRGRRLKAPAGDRTRPTSDMVRQALFNLLGQQLDDPLVLDVFCGSGALGLEALSRGAQRAWLVDKARAACDVARANAAELAVLAQVTVVQADAARALLELPAGAATLALCDPPYAVDHRAALLDALAHAVRPGGTLVFETADDVPALEPSPHWELRDRRAYGSTALHLLTRAAP